MALALALLALSGCGAPVVEEKSKLTQTSVIATKALANGASLHIEKSYAGGATGDTLHKAWVCKLGITNCQLAATIDSHEGPPPEVRTTASGAELVIRSTDTVWGFANFFYGPDGSGFRITLTER